MAHETDILLGGEAFIDRIVREDGGFAEKIVSRVLSLDKAFAKLGDKESKAQHKLVREAERLYLKAAEAAGNGTLKKMILAQVPELEEELMGVNEEKMQVSEGKDIDIYTEEQYNRFGWASDAGALTTNEIDDVYSKVMEKGSLRRFPQSIDGEAIIVVNDKAKTTLEAEDVFVFAIGKRDDFAITKVIRPFYYTEDVRVKARKAIYGAFKKYSYNRALEFTRNVMLEDGFISDFYGKNYPSYQEYWN